MRGRKFCTRINDTIDAPRTIIDSSVVAGVVPVTPLAAVGVFRGAQQTCHCMFTPCELVSIVLARTASVPFGC